MTAAAFRLLVFTALAAGSAALWLSLLHSGDLHTSLGQAIAPEASQSIFAPATRSADQASGIEQLPHSLGPGLAVHRIVSGGRCSACALQLGPGGLVRAQAGTGSASRNAYALLDLSEQGAAGSIVARDALSLGRGESPAGPAGLMQMLDGEHRVVFALVAQPNRQLRLQSPAGGLRGSAVDVATGAVVPNDGVSSVAVEVALRRNRTLAVYVNGVRTVALGGLQGAVTSPPRYLATGVVGYTAPATAAALTALHTGVSVSSTAPAPGPAPAPSPAPAANPAPAPAPTPPRPVSPPVTPSAPQTAPPPAPAPRPPAPVANSTPPTVEGAGVVGTMLKATSGTWTDGSAAFGYAWQRCSTFGSCTTIDAATRPQYTLVAADVGALVRVRVTATTATSSASKSSAAVGPVVPRAPVASADPGLAGTPVEGSTLTATPGTWSDPTARFGYVWLRCDGGTCSTIAEVAAATYTLTAEDVGFGIVVAVSATNAGGTTTALSAAAGPVLPAAPTATAAPSISGEPRVGSTLTGHGGSWSDPGATLAYAWQRCDQNGACSTIADAAAAAYTLTAEDVGFSIVLAVTATNAGGTTTALSAAAGPVLPAAPSATAAPSISGEPRVGSTLTGDPGSWSDPHAALAYAWQRCDASGACSTIADAAAATYTLTDDDLGFGIVVAVSASNAGGTTTALSAAAGPVLPALAPLTATAAPSISGEPHVGSTLTGDGGSWSDANATLTYAWQRCDDNGACSTIADATAATYTLPDADLGRRIRLEVTATSADGASGTADSAPVGPIKPVLPTRNDPPGGGSPNEPAAPADPRNRDGTAVDPGDASPTP